MAEPPEERSEPPYPYFYRTAVQKEKTRWHKLLKRIECELLPNLRRWKFMYKSAHPSLVKENARLRKRVVELERLTGGHDAPPQPARCLNCGGEGPHFAPPSLGEMGFFVCEKKVQPAPRLGPGHNHANEGYHADCGWCVRGFTSREIPLQPAADEVQPVPAGFERPYCGDTACSGCRLDQAYSAGVRDGSAESRAAGIEEGRRQALLLTHDETGAQLDWDATLQRARAAGKREMAEKILRQWKLQATAGTYQRFGSWLTARAGEETEG